MGDWSSDVATATFAGTPESVRDARRFVLDVLAPVDDELAGDAALLASELATNAVIHAQTSFQVVIRHEADAVRVEVQDGSTASARRCRYSATSGTGRGLGMVEDLAEQWGIDPAGAGKAVWFVLATRRRATTDDERTASEPQGEVDLDALLADLGGWEDPSESTDAALRRAA